MKNLKYYAIPAGILVFSFLFYISYHSYQRNKPVVYIDNFSGGPVELIWNGEIFLTIPNNTSEINRDLGIGRRIIYAKKVGKAVIDTIKMDLQTRGKYVLNLFGAMEYFSGQVTYMDRERHSPGPISRESRITSKFFKPQADYLFERPPATIEVYTKKSKYNYNIERVRRYLRRGNPIQVGLDQPVMANESATVPTSPVSENKVSTPPRPLKPPTVSLHEEEAPIVKDILISIAKGRTKEALKSLSTSQPEIATPLQERFEEVSKKRRLSTILITDYYLEVNKISHAIMSGLPRQKTPARKVPENSLQSLINAAKLEEAIDLAIAAGQREAVLLQGQLSILNQDRLNGLISEQNFKTEEARIRQGLLYFNENY